MLLRGNYKSARSALITADPEKAIDKEVEHGWELPLKIDSLCQTEKARVVPLGAAKKLSTDKKGERYTKICATHDCSFPGSSGLPVKN